MALVRLGTLVATSAHADCLGLAKGITSACLADTGAGKVAILHAQNQKCIRRHVSDISRAWRHFDKVVDSLDPQRIAAEAANVRHQTLGRSNMFTSCWNTMKKNCEIVGGAVDNAIKAIRLDQCK